MNTVGSRHFSSYSRILEKDESNIDAWQILTVHELVREGSTATVSHLRTRKLSQEHISVLGGRGRMIRYEFRSRPCPHKRQRVGGRGPEGGGDTLT